MQITLYITSLIPSSSAIQLKPAADEIKECPNEAIMV